jgi:hypothetical protein
VGDGVKEVGGEEGGDEVPVIDKGDGGNAAGTNRSDGAVLKFRSGSSKKVLSFNFTAKCDPLVHWIWVENGVGE